MINDKKYKCIKSIKPVEWLCGFKSNEYYRIHYKGTCAGMLFYEIEGEKPDERYHNMTLSENTIKEFFDLTSCK